MNDGSDMKRTLRKDSNSMCVDLDIEIPYPVMVLAASLQAWSGYSSEKDQQVSESSIKADLIFPQSQI